MVTYDIAKTEAMLFFKSYCQQLNKQIAEINIKIRAKNIQFNKEATWWLEIWLDSQLKFISHVNEKVRKACTAKIQIKRLMQTYRLAFSLIKRIQIVVVVQSIALYRTELWWKGQKNYKNTLQKLLNRQARVITGMYLSIPIQALLSKTGFIPAKMLLDFCQIFNYSHYLIITQQNISYRLVLKWAIKAHSLESNLKILSYELKIQALSYLTIC